MGSETNPENGTTSYVYDIDLTDVCPFIQYGQLIKKTDAMGNVTCFAYDGMGRIASKTYNDTVTDDVGFSYDSGTNGGGRLTAAWTCAAGTVPCPVSSYKTQETFGYDKVGNQLTHRQISPRTSPNWNTVTETFDAIEHISSMSMNGTGLWQATAWDGEARPTTVVNYVANDTPLQSTAIYNLHTAASPTTVTYGNGDIITTGYDNLGHINYSNINVGGQGTATQTDTIT